MVLAATPYHAVTLCQGTPLVHAVTMYQGSPCYWYSIGALCYYIILDQIVCCTNARCALPAYYAASHLSFPAAPRLKFCCCTTVEVVGGVTKHQRQQQQQQRDTELGQNRGSIALPTQNRGSAQASNPVRSTNSLTHPTNPLFSQIQHQHQH